LNATEHTRIAALEFDGWDTHAEQGTTNGRLAILLQGLGDGLADLASASGTAWRQTVVVVVSELGRSVVPNRNGGTDHGAASFAMLLGGAVAGGRILGGWPGVTAERLVGGTGLTATVDLRGIFKGILMEHLGVSRAAVETVIFPGTAHVLPISGLVRS
jgi:uncharacterized protein (DUF1501 family)